MEGVPDRPRCDCRERAEDLLMSFNGTTTINCTEARMRGWKSRVVSHEWIYVRFRRKIFCFFNCLFDILNRKNSHYWSTYVENPSFCTKRHFVLINIWRDSINWTSYTKRDELKQYRIRNMDRWLKFLTKRTSIFIYLTSSLTASFYFYFVPFVVLCL